MSTIFHNIAVINRAIKKFGERKQLIVAIEEMSELTKVLCKFLREDTKADKMDKNLRENICEEIADTEIMLAQLMIIFHAYDEVMQYKWIKLQRLEDRLNEKGEES